MGKYGFISLVLAVSGSVLWNGCRTGSAARIQADDLRQDDASASGVGLGNDTEGLKIFLAEGAQSSRTFQQVDVGRRRASPWVYQREIQPQGRVEGSLIGRVEFPLGQYLDPHSRGGKRPRVDWPYAGRGAVDAFFIEFKPAIMEWPVEAQEGELIEALAQVTAFEHDGVPFAYGTCRRTMRMVGFESVGADEKSFEDAVRMEAETELTFGWFATIRVQETAWFARGVGLVRREERFTGRALWLFRFQGASRYELADEEAARVETVADEVAQSAKGEKSLKGVEDEESDDVRNALSARQGGWSRLAICFERTGRRIRLSGMAIEWAGVDGQSTVD